MKLYEDLLKEVNRYKYLGLPFGGKGLDTGRMCEVSIAKAVRTASLFHSLDATAEGSRLQYAGECSNVDHPTEHEI